LRLEKVKALPRISAYILDHTMVIMSLLE